MAVSLSKKLDDILGDPENAPGSLKYSITNPAFRLMAYRNNSNNNITARKIATQFALPFLYIIQVIEIIVMSIFAFLLSPICIGKNFYMNHFVLSLGIKVFCANMLFTNIFTNLFRSSFVIPSQDISSLTEKLVSKLKKKKDQAKKCTFIFKTLVTRIIGIIESIVYPILNIITAPLALFKCSEKVNLMFASLSTGSTVSLQAIEVLR